MATKTVVQRETHQIDAAGKPLGRLASQIAQLLRGKHKPTFQPHVDAGDLVEVTNVKQIKYTGNKLVGKTYYRHSGFPGGIKKATLKERLDRGQHEEVLRDAVYNMLPENKLRAPMMKRIIIK